jgi:thiamine biosynthesis protein ThiS
VSIFVNSKEQVVPDACTVQMLIEINGLTDKRVAVEVNQELVVRNQWSSHKLEAGDRVEIVSFVGGG